jgi:hypothetical protein
MSEPKYNPQQPSNLHSSGTTKTTRFFNNFYIPTYTVSENTNDAILSFFQQQTDNLDSAKLLAQALIDTAQAQREDPMTVITEFQKLPEGELNAILALYLNTTRVNTSLLGIKNRPRTNPYVARSILS